MIREFMLRSAALLLTASAAAIGASSAQAADLGGNCCADLEERIAELEATTARKGNRKVTLEITGWVNEALFLFDDGVESNTYVATNALEQSRVSFNGKAKITEDLTAGYRLEIGFGSPNSSGVSQLSDDPENTLQVRHSHWYLSSKTLGKIAVGRNGTATYHLLDDADAVNTRSYSDAEASAVYTNGFRLRSGGQFIDGNVTWGGITPGTNNDSFGQNGRREVVRYDSPEFAGFTFTGSWGEDDMAGVALTYKNKVGDFSLLGKVGYEKTTDENPATEACNSITTINLDCHWWGAAATILHEPTGLFVYGGYGEQDDKSEERAFANADGKDSFWFVQAGIEKKFFPIGKSTIFGEYREDDRGSNSGIVDGANTFADNDIQSANLEFWSIGIVQAVDNAAMDLYLMYRHSEGDLTQVDTDRLSLDDLDLVITGAKIKF